jgi:hypothetical protein
MRRFELSPTDQFITSYFSLKTTSAVRNSAIGFPSSVAGLNRQRRFTIAQAAASSRSLRTSSAPAPTIVEVDGGQHSAAENALRDQRRTRWLEARMPGLPGLK